MGEITISVKEYKELLDASIRIEMLTKKVKKDRYIGRENVMEILGIEDEKEDKNDTF